MYMRYDMRDGRRLPPRNSRGEFRRRRSRRDRGMDYGYDMNYTVGRGGYPMNDYGDYAGNMARGDRAGNMDGHYPMQGGQSMGGQTYYPIEAMGRFNGYWGMPEQDYARGGRGRDYGYMDYGYDYGDYGETLSEQELEKWNKKLMSKFDEREKQMFHKDMITQKAKQMGIQMEGFGEKELYTATLMCYSDYKHSIGQNPDMAIKLAKDWLNDKDAAVKGAEKLAVYYDEIVEGGEE